MAGIVDGGGPFFFSNAGIGGRWSSQTPSYRPRHASPFFSEHSLHLRFSPRTALEFLFSLGSRGDPPFLFFSSYVHPRQLPHIAPLVVDKTHFFFLLSPRGHRRPFFAFPILRSSPRVSTEGIDADGPPSLLSNGIACEGAPRAGVWHRRGVTGKAAPPLSFTSLSKAGFSDGFLFSFFSFPRPSLDGESGRSISFFVVIDANPPPSSSPRPLSDFAVRRRTHPSLPLPAVALREFPFPYLLTTSS